MRHNFGTVNTPIHANHCMQMQPNELPNSLIYIGKIGAAGGDRTHDPWLRRPILYPLSYSRTGEMLKETEGYRLSGFPSM